MRWYEPKSGDRKVKRKFALLPITIGKETRWLEWVKIQYWFSDRDRVIDSFTHKAYITYGWIKECFIDESN